MYTIVQLSAATALLDGVPEADMSAIDKALRNLSQRSYLMPTARVGKALAYDLPGTATLRLIYIASRIGLGAEAREDLLRWMTRHGGEAVSRAQSGEIFDLTLSTWSFAQHRSVSATWEEKVTKGSRADKALDLTRGSEIGRVVMPLSTLVVDLMRALESAAQ